MTTAGLLEIHHRQVRALGIVLRGEPIRGASKAATETLVRDDVPALIAEVRRLQALVPDA